MCEVSGMCAIYTPFQIVFKIPHGALQASGFVSSCRSGKQGAGSQGRVATPFAERQNGPENALSS